MNAGVTVDIGGSAVRLDAAADHPAGSTVEVLVRPESTVLRDPGAGEIPATIVSRQFQGARTRFLVHPHYQSDPTATIISDVSGTRHDELAAGIAVSITIDAKSALVTAK